MNARVGIDVDPKIDTRDYRLGNAHAKKIMVEYKTVKTKTYLDRGPN